MSKTTKTEIAAMRAEVQKVAPTKIKFDWARLSLDELQTLEALLPRLIAGEILKREEEEKIENLASKASLAGGRGQR